jgi:penicillin-binding protein 2
MDLPSGKRYPAGVSPAAAGPAASSAAAESLVSIGRLRAFAAVVFCLFSMLVSRLWYLQILKGADFRDQAENNRTRTVRAVAPRGVITDWEGDPLVTNGAQFTVFVDPKDLPKDDAAREAEYALLADLLKGAPKPLTPEGVAELRKRAKKKNADPIAVSEGVDMHTLARLYENGPRLPGVNADPEPVRQYPQKHLASHVVGYIGPISDKELADPDNVKLGYQGSDFIGKDGVEKQYDHLLNGTEGGTVYEVDAKGRRKRELERDEPVVGATLRLTLQRRVQQLAEQRLSAYKGGAAVMVDVHTGRVLAMASAPAFDPNVFAKRPLHHDVWNAINDPKVAPLVNRSITSVQPPGSTFKIITSAAGLATGKITDGTYVGCAGGLHIGPTWKRCDGVHGGVNLLSGLSASCDTFYYVIGLRMGPNTIADWGEKFGLGARTGVDLPQEYRGRMASPAWKRHFVEDVLKKGDPNWYDGETANIAIGQGDILATPVQDCLVAAAVANGGTVYKPYVLESAKDYQNRVVYQAKPEVLHKVPLTPEQFQRLGAAMRAVVAGPRGTARAINTPAIAIAGKTGTAEKKSKATGQDTTIAWFTCYAPYDKPEVAVCVMVESGGKAGNNLFGASSAAPIARDMILAYYNKLSAPDAAPAEPAPVRRRRNRRR